MNKHSNHSVKVAGVVVLYQPTQEVLNNIKTYISQIGKLFVVDNSESYDRSLLSKIQDLPNVEYICNNGNKGIAYALNVGAELAMENNFHWLLTMDQDTSVSDNMIDTLLNYVTEYPKIGILSPRHFGNNDASKSMFEMVLFTMTSANLLNLEAYKIAGRFKDELFIDHVDHEYCLRLTSLGFSIVECTSVSVKHSLGTPVKGRFLFWSKIVKGHSPVRLYYIVRNGLYVVKWYPNVRYFRVHVYRTILKEAIKVILFYDNPGACIRAMLKGLNDYRLNKTGKYG